jgi:hypothetical protein
MPTSTKRRLLLGLRRRVKVLRRFTVEPIDGGRERLTCTTCGTVVEQPVGGEGANVCPGIVEKLAAYRAHGTGVSGYCDKCTRDERDRRYPLEKT